MPHDFPEQWENRVTTVLEDEIEAPWLEGVTELDTEVIEAGSGSASEANFIHIPITTFRPGVLINNTTYPIEAVPYEDGSMMMKLDKYQTKVTTLSDDQIHGSSYKQIDSVTKSHTDDIKETKFAKAIHSIAPAADNGNNEFVIQATGEEVTPGGRRRLVWADLARAKARMDDQRCKKKGRYAVLSNDHENDLLMDNTNKMADKLADYLAGTLKGTLAGFQIFTNIDNPEYTAAGAKRPFGAVPNATDRTASVFYHPGNLRKKTGNTKQYFKAAADDPDYQTNRYNLRHYFLCLPVMEKYRGAII